MQGQARAGPGIPLLTPGVVCKALLDSQCLGNEDNQVIPSQDWAVPPWLTPGTGMWCPWIGMHSKYEPILAQAPMPMKPEAKFGIFMLQ